MIAARFGAEAGVVVARHRDVDLSYHHASEQLGALKGTGRAVFAALPIDTVLDPQSR